MSKAREFSAEAEAAFFGSYDGVPVHEKMIKDDIRTKSYLTAIEDNSHLFQDKIVLDIGTGTGILSMFCVRAGARHVYAIDVSNMIHNARKIAATNGMSDKITFIQGKVEEVDVPQVDIIVSEWMGFCLLSEIMLDCLLLARDRYLIQGGLMFPDRVSAYLAGIEDQEKIDSKVVYWNDIHGLDFSPLKPAAISKGFLRLPNANQVVTKPTCVLDLDLQTLSRLDPVLENISYTLTAYRADTVHALLAWFDYDFTFGKGVVHVSTGPFHPPTHWKQTVFYLENELYVQRGDRISGTISFEQSLAQRDLSVRLSYVLEGDITETDDVSHGDTEKNGDPKGILQNGIRSANGNTKIGGSGIYKVDAVE